MSIVVMLRHHKMQAAIIGIVGYRNSLGYSLPITCLDNGTIHFFYPKLGAKPTSQFWNPIARAKVCLGPLSLHSKPIYKYTALEQGKIEW